MESTYEYGKLHGIVYCWSVDGKLVSEESFSMGIYDGVNRTWFENGQLKREEYYSKGTKTGVWKQWFENGVLEWEESYKNDNINGLVRRWFPSGQLKYTGEIREVEFVSTRVGRHQTWFENGQLSSDFLYDETGKFIIGTLWNEDGEMMSSN
jgi:antitoxin component YwqK of YwqJK toxin-antitoxin module